MCNGGVVRLSLGGRGFRPTSSAETRRRWGGGRDAIGGLLSCSDGSALRVGEARPKVGGGGGGGEDAKTRCGAGDGTELDRDGSGGSGPGCGCQDEDAAEGHPRPRSASALRIERGAEERWVCA